MISFQGVSRPRAALALGLAAHRTGQRRAQERLCAEDQMPRLRNQDGSWRTILMKQCRASAPVDQPTAAEQIVGINAA